MKKEQTPDEEFASNIIGLFSGACIAVVGDVVAQETDGTVQSVALGVAALGAFVALRSVYKSFF